MIAIPFVTKDRPTQPILTPEEMDRIALLIAQGLTPDQAIARLFG